MSLGTEALASTLTTITTMRATTLVFTTLSLLGSSVRSSVIHPLFVQSGGAWSGGEDAVKVPVILGVMSACPDAILCESVFDHVLQRIGEKIDLGLSFIGK